MCGVRDAECAAPGAKICPPSLQAWFDVPLFSGVHHRDGDVMIAEIIDASLRTVPIALWHEDD